jgi:uncharacterized protein
VDLHPVVLVEGAPEGRVDLEAARHEHLVAGGFARSSATRRYARRSMPRRGRRLGPPHLRPLTRDAPYATMTETREVVAMKLEEALGILAAHRAQLRALGVEQVSVFGSVARNEAGEDSDIDILVEFAPGARIGMFEFLDIQEALSRLLGTDVDLATPASLHPGLRDAILAEAVRAA